MNRLSELYKNQNIYINNNKKYCYLDNIEDINNTKTNINDFLNDYNNYKNKVHIITNNKTYYTYIISKTKDSIYTLEDEKIPLKDIIDITP